MKKLFSMVLVSAMLVSGCGGAEPTAEVPEKAVTAETMEENTAEKATEMAAEKAEKKAEEIDLTKYAVPLEVLWKETTIHEEDVFDGSYESLRLSAESAAKYPALAEAMDAIEAEAYAIFEQESKEFTEWSLEDEWTMEYYNHNATLVQRADNQIVSVRKDNSIFTGGAHSMYGSWGMNLDTESGKELLLSDVVTDMSRIPKLTAAKIMEKYQEEVSEDFSWLEESLQDQAAEAYEWTMDHEGITIYFQPYEIASFAAGLLTAEISFEEYPELFHEKYLLPYKNGYAVRVNGESRTYDTDPTDGETSDVWLHACGTLEEDADNGEMELMINLNNGSVMEKRYADKIVPYFVCLREGDAEKYFLYIETAVDNEYTMNIYELHKNGIQLFKKADYTPYEERGEDGIYKGMLIDPAKFLEK